MLTRTTSQSLTEQLSARFAQRIRDRLLAPGARLPSVRQCAQQQGVSPSTVVAAYDQLLAHGMVEARKNRGFFVRESRTDTMPATAESGAGNGPAARTAATAVTAAARHYAPIDATALIRGMFHKVSNKPQPGMGVFPPEWLESTFMPAAVRKVTSTRSLQEFSLQYGEPLGDGGLRRALSKRLAALSVHAPPENIITTVGATHALDIVSRTLLRPGDQVMVEDPGWAVEFARLTALGMRLLPVPRGPDGPQLDVMARYCEVHQPKLYVSVSVFHNPTGYCLSPGSAHRVLQLANQYDFHIVEDDTYSHIAPEHATRLCALDGLQRTIYVSGFAKILAPNWRVGFLAAHPLLIERLLDTKLLATLTTPALLEKALALCIEQGQLRRHAERIKTRLGAARSRSVKLALNAGCTFAAEPAGLFGWVDTGVDTDALAQRMLDEGYLLAPGALFHAQRKPSTLMRINFATTQDAVFWKKFTELTRKNSSRA
jgi:DNA-binding transcriptional MocR family regulator